MKNTRFQACSAARTGYHAVYAPRQKGQIVARAPLSDLQYAYLLGELSDHPLGGPALLYEEYACDGLDVIAFSRALFQLMSRHEMLRTTFDASGTLRVHSSLPVPLAYHCLRGQPEDVSRRRLAASREECYRHGTSLVDAAPFAVRVFALDDATTVQVVGRLLAMDRVSTEIFARDLRALLSGEPLPPLHHSFREHRGDAERRKELPEYAAARAHWLKRLDALPAAPQLPRPRSAALVDRGLNRRTYRMPAGDWATFAKAINRHRLTPKDAIGAAFCEVLRYWTKNPHFAINVLFSERSRTHHDMWDVIGNFNSTVLLECARQPRDRTFLARARSWGGRLKSDLRQSAFSGVSVVREHHQRNGGPYETLSPVVFACAVGDGSGDGGLLEDLGWQRLDSATRMPMVSLSHAAYLIGDQLVIQWDTADEAFAPGVIDDMFAAYRTLLTRLATSDEAWHRESFDFAPAAQREIRARVNATAGPVPAVTLHELFLRSAERQPDAPAVVTPTERVTYAGLRSRANAIATALAARGVGAGDLVGVSAVRDANQIAALLGVLMAGAAYVPISPRWPDPRREQVAELCGLRLLVLGETAAAVSAGVDVLGLADAVRAYADSPAVPCARDSESLAYGIFNAAASGPPKGVMISHSAAVNTILDINERFAVGARDRVLAVSDPASHLSVWDVFGMLAAGGAVVVPGPAAAREVIHVHDLALRHEVTIWNSVPAYLAVFVEFVRSCARRRLPTLRLALVSGDRIPLTLGRDLADMAPNAACVSLGEATEAFSWTAFHPVPASPPEDWVRVPLGYPLRNQRFYVLDTDLRDRPDWVPGELYLAGRGLPDGHVGGEEDAAAAFATHPGSGETIYRTGDWVRYLPGGALEFLGRDDQRVTVKGNRVELAEIEAVLLTHPAVDEAAVVASHGARGIMLVGFVASASDPADLPDGLRTYLQQWLPGYMVPRTIHVCRSLPRTGLGTVDRRLLGERALAASATPLPRGAAPVGPVERALARIWQELLEIHQIGRSEDFFACGGTSLHAARLMNRIELEFGQRLRLSVLDAAPTIEKLARRMTAQARAERRDSLVRLGDISAGDPLVLVHPAGGDLQCYRHLVPAVETRRAVYGVCASGRCTGGTIEEMAARYLTEVLAVTEDRPVHLAGWSLGGVVAYEMGRRLLSERRECTVVMIDPWLRRDGGWLPSDATLVTSFLYDLAESEMDFGELAPDAQEPAPRVLHRIWRKAREDVAVLKSLSFDELSVMYQVFAGNTSALLRYAVTAEPDLPVQVVEASDGLGGPAGAYLSPLRETMPGFAATLSLPGNHFTLLGLDTAPKVAELL